MSIVCNGKKMNVNFDKSIFKEFELIFTLNVKNSK